ncbi:MAG: GH116 family glycosyl-hydrolase [Ferruginibacter sp.]
MPVKMKKLRRREFLSNAGILTAGLLTLRVPVIGSSGGVVGENVLSAGLMDPEWIKSLYNRGTVTTYSKIKNELQYIGMPVGGINCGTLYLGGDGRLWLWDIFNKNQEGVEPKVVLFDDGTKEVKKIKSRDGACYVQPSKDIRPLEQGFAIKIKYKGVTVIKRFHQDDWEEVKFEATYPVAVIHYSDSKIPIEIKLTAFSPFIPLDEDNSNIPVTIQSFEIKNAGKEAVQVEITGWLENAVNKFSATETTDGRRTNKVISDKKNVFVLSTFDATDKSKLAEAGDTGSMCLSYMGAGAKGIASFQQPFSTELTDQKTTNEFSVNAVEKLVAGITTNTVQLLPGKSVKKEFAISWCFPNVGKRIAVPDAATGNYYLNKFSNAFEVATYVARQFPYLAAQTKLWKNTWYDSTLPWWLSERTFSNISTLATTTSHRFKTGRSWAWEGVGACEGNCTHVWQYAQAVGRIFPAIEKDNRQRVDLGLSLMEDGGIWFRGEYEKRPAIDGQAGTVLRIYREHQMSSDDSFLRANWNKIKRAIQFIINQDRNRDGMEDNPMENTLDAVWDGEIAWIVGLCVAAVKAGEMMAIEMNDESFALTCREYAEKGRRNMESKLFNGEYFIHRPDAEKGRKKLGAYNTCHIDQVYGQSWAFQVGLGRVLDKEKTVSALQALWKYNFKTDVGPYIKDHTGGRPYALPGEAGMIMNTNPSNEAKPYGEDTTWQLGYFHECMSGFEHQVASHMMAEGMTDEAMILTRAIHDRYHAFKRNPFNEIECSDHYARAMASYGTFVTACGFEYHGPKGFIAFSPKWNKGDFKAPFVTAKGWGTYTQKFQKAQMIYSLELKYGHLQLKNIRLQKANKGEAKKVTAMIGTKKIQVEHRQIAANILLDFKELVNIRTNQTLIITIQ